MGDPVRVGVVASDPVLEAGARITLSGSPDVALAVDGEPAQVVVVMVDRVDDAKIGIRPSALTVGRADVLAVGVCYAIYLIGMALAGLVHSLGPIYYAALAIALLIATHHLWIIRGRDPAACFRAFLGNHWLGMAVFAGVAVDYAYRARQWPHVW